MICFQIKFGEINISTLNVAHISSVRSVSHHKAVVAFGLAVLVADETIAALSQRLALDV